MINLGGGLNNIISDVIDDTISGVIDNAISGVEKYSKKHRKNNCSNTALSACHASTVSAISNTLLGHISIKHLRKNLPLCTITAVRRGSWQRR